MDAINFYGGRKATQVSTINEANEIVRTTRKPINVVVLPPSTGDSQNQESDIEEIPENSEESFEPAGELEVEEEIDDSDEDDEDDETRQKLSHHLIWKKSYRLHNHFETLYSNICEKVMLELGEKSPYEIWEALFTPNILQHIISETNRYANRDKNQPNFCVSEDEMRQFLGIIFISGYHTVPEESDYWSTQPDLCVPIVQNTMSRNRYLEIKKYIHFADNQNLTKGDKMSKISPLYNMINDNLVRFGIFHKLLSVDESMVPYFGRHSAKQFIRAKPIRYGYKLWVLCGNDGYPYNFQIYKGKEQNPQNLPLGTRVIQNMVRIMRSYSDPLAHELYFDNFFTSYELMRKLASLNVRATGTIRQNRLCGANKVLICKKALQKKERGNFDFCTDGNVYLAKWHDSSIVTIASNWETHMPVRKVKRRVKGGEKEVDQPHVFSSYNKGMGGVDLLDRLSAYYRPSIRGKKWYWQLFTNFLNVTLIAAWRIHCKVSEKKMRHIDFRRNITLCLLKGDFTPISQPMPRGAEALPETIRYDGKNHILGSTSQGRCKVCKINTKNMCEKCNVRLHAERGKRCFYIYHNF